MSKQSCPCGLSKDFDQCCGPFLRQEKSPATAEATMRARYTAYVRGEMDYLQKTHHPLTRESFNLEEARKWSSQSTWLGLSIVNAEKGMENDQEGKVEFIARYQYQNKEQNHHEISDFKKENGQWYFVDGHLITGTQVRQTPKVGRNDPCSCGSGKKFKKCCGK